MVRQKIEESVPVQEVKTPAVLSVKHFSKSGLIILLSLFCIFVGGTIYQLSQPVEDLTPIPKEVTTLYVAPKHTPPQRASVMFQHPPKVETAPSTPDPKENIIDDEDVSLPSETDMISTPSKPVQEEKISLPVSAPIVLPPPEPVEPLLTLENALQLRDHLAVGQSCLGDLKIVMKVRLPNQTQKDRLIEKLMPVCTVRSAFQELEETFYQNRKKALMTYYRLNNPLWLAYLKTVGASLVDIRKLNPSKEKPKDIISMAQNALVMKDLKEVIQKIQKLPPEIQSDFRNFIEQAETYLTAQKEVEDLILSFSRKGV